MSIKSKCKNKSQCRYNYYKSFGWLGRIAYRLRGDKQIRKYLSTGKYKRVTSDVPYQLSEDVDLYVVDQFISSTIKRSRVKMKPDGCLCISKSEYSKYGIESC